MVVSFREVAVLPVLLAQAVYVRRKALVMPEAAGARIGVVGRGPVLRVLVLGDSSAAGVGVGTQAEALLGQLLLRLQDRFTVHYHLIAKTGLTSAQSTAMLRDEGIGPYDLAVVALGVNDVTRLVRPHHWATQQEDLHHLLKAQYGVRFICRSQLPPMGLFPLLPDPLRGVLGQRAARLNVALQAIVAADPQIAQVSLEFEPDAGNMAPDGYHPSAKIYAAWAARVMDVLPDDIL